jgi:hypothetical protein
MAADLLNITPPEQLLSQGGGLVWIIHEPRLPQTVKDWVSRPKIPKQEVLW